MANIMDDFPSKYLKGEELEDHPTVTISRVTREEVGKDREVRPILYLNEYEQGVVLNKTNAGNIARMYGTETDNWPGKTVVLGTEMVTFNGETKPAIRIWPPKRPAARPSVNAPLTTNGRQFDDRNPPPAELSDDVPF
jgi:hypothetical protein